MLEARNRYAAEMDLSPDNWFRYEMYDRLDSVRQQVAAYIHADAGDVAFVENASHGVNAVLRSVRPRAPRNKILYLNLAYQMVKNTLQFVHDADGEQLVMVNVTFPVESSGASIVAAVTQALEAHPGQIYLASFSHITSIPAIILPLEQLIAACHAHGALVLIDGAHALGQIALDVPALNADFYVANGHKWLYSPKGSAVLWVRKDRQALINPTTISWEGQGWLCPFLCQVCPRLKKNDDLNPPPPGPFCC